MNVDIDREYKYFFFNIPKIVIINENTTNKFCLKLLDLNN